MHPCNTGGSPRGSGRLVPRVTQLAFSMAAPCEKEGRKHGAARGTADTVRRHDEGQDGETRVELRFGGGGNHNLFNSGTLPYVVVGVYSGLGPSRGDLSRRERGQNAIAGASSRTDGAADGKASA